MDTAQIIQIIKMAWPLIALQLALQIYTIVDVLRKKKTKNLSVGLWIAIIVLGEILGPILYFLLGRPEE